MFSAAGRGINGPPADGPEPARSGALLRPREGGERAVLSGAPRLRRARDA